MNRRNMLDKEGDEADLDNVRRSALAQQLNLGLYFLRRAALLKCLDGALKC